MDTRTMLGTLLAALLVAAAAAPAVGAAPDAGTPPVGIDTHGGPGRPPVIRVHDLGTLGGPTSEAVAVNERGQVVGTSVAADGQEHAFLWERGVMRDLGTLPGRWARVRAVNERGLVVGDCIDDATGTGRAVLWDEGRIRDLGIDGSALDVNGRNQVLVRFSDGEYSQTGVWRRGVITQIGNLSDVYPWTVAADMNDRGWVTGYAPVGPQGVHRGFLWRDGTLVDIGAPEPGGNSYPVGINDAGQIAAEAQMPDGSSRAAVWQDGRWTDLGDLGQGSSPSAINDRGVVAGQAPARGTLTAVLFHDGRVIDLGALVPGVGSSSVDLNNRAQVVGRVDLTWTHRVGALWQDGAAYLLPGLTPDGRSHVRDINDRGQMVGGAITPSGDLHAVLWTTR